MVPGSMPSRPRTRTRPPGASAAQPSFVGELAVVRLHQEAMTDEEIAHNFNGGVMLGTEMHSWWRTEGPETWWTKESPHFRHCVSKEDMAEWDQGRLARFHKDVPGMFEMAEKLYYLYSERLAKRSSVVSGRTSPPFRLGFSASAEPSVSWSSFFMREASCLKNSPGA